MSSQSRPVLVISNRFTILHSNYLADVKKGTRGIQRVTGLHLIHVGHKAPGCVSSLEITQKPRNFDCVHSYRQSLIYLQELDYISRRKQRQSKHILEFAYIIPRQPVPVVARSKA
jgi:hypothetical protein